MSEQDSTPKPTQVQIAEAIRAKRERRAGLSIREELDAMEAALLADIDAFDLDAAAKQVQAQEQKVKGPGLVADAGALAFPDIVAEGASPRVVAEAKAKPKAESAAPAGLPLGSGGLLEQLRSEAERRQNLQDAEQRQLSLVEAQLDRALHQVFAYLHELVQQLNVIKPPVPRAYLVAGSQELKGLSWEQGFSDYRTRPQSAGASMESVSFTYKLAGKQPLVMERDGTVADGFRQQLFDLNLAFKVEEFRNERRYLERARFIVAPEVKVNVRWEADYEKGKLVVQARNLERLGTTRYSFDPDALNQALLDEFGRLVLGHPHHFPR